MKIKLDDKRLQYSGRIDDSDPERPEFVFAASFLSFCFKGTAAYVTITNKGAYWDNYLGVIADGEQNKVLLPKEGTKKIELVQGSAEDVHQIMIFKRQDSCHEFALEELEIEGELLEPEPLPQRRIEVYGDSVSAGEVSEAVEYAGKEDPEHHGEYSNSWYSYSWITARRLNAQLHDVAQGGAALLNGTGWFCGPDYVGMESIWNKIHYNPELGDVTDWDFKRYTPHVVIVALGQNDSHPEDYMKEDPAGDKAQQWKKAYESWIGKLRMVYPKACIILTTTILNHDCSWDQAIEEVCRRLSDPCILHFTYSQNGCGTPGHIRIPEAEQMALELSSFIEGLPEAIWD